MLRLATQTDIAAGVAAGREFHELAYPDIPYCEDSTRKTLTWMVEHGTLIVSIRDGELLGAIGGFVSPRSTNFAYRMMIENFWWVKPANRGSLGIRLLAAFEQRARDLNCHDIYMIAMEHMAVEGVEAIYRRMGYAPAERGYRKRL